MFRQLCMFDTCVTVTLPERVIIVTIMVNITEDGGSEEEATRQNRMPLDSDQGDDRWNVTVVGAFMSRFPITVFATSVPGR